MLAERGIALADQPLLLIGDDGLCARYVDALQEFGHPHARIVAHATDRGLWRIASRAAVRADGEPSAPTNELFAEDSSMPSDLTLPAPYAPTPR